MKKLNILDDTLIYYIIGDNGASAEGTLNGAYNEMANFNGLAALETLQQKLADIPTPGGPTPRQLEVSNQETAFISAQTIKKRLSKE